MANNEAGAFLNITPDVLKKLDSFDEKLEKIEKHAHTASDALKNGFGKVVIDTTKLENAITSLANKMNALNSAGNVVQNIGTSMGNATQSANKMATATSSVTQNLSGIAQITNQLYVSRPFENWNIAQIESEITSLNKVLKKNTPILIGDKRLSQQEIVDRRNALQEELKIQETSTAAKMSAIAKVANVQNADAIRQKKVVEDNAKRETDAANAKTAAQIRYNTVLSQANEILNKASSVSLGKNGEDIKKMASDLSSALQRLQSVTNEGVKDGYLKGFNASVKNGSDNVRQLTRELEKALGESGLNKNAPTKSFEKIVEDSKAGTIELARMGEEIRNIRKLQGYSGSNLSNDQYKQLEAIKADYQAQIKAIENAAKGKLSEEEKLQAKLTAIREKEALKNAALQERIAMQSAATRERIELQTNAKISQAYASENTANARANAANAQRAASAEKHQQKMEQMNKRDEINTRNHLGRMEQQEAAHNSRIEQIRERGAQSRANIEARIEAKTKAHNEKVRALQEAQAKIVSLNEEKKILSNSTSQADIQRIRQINVELARQQAIVDANTNSIRNLTRHHRNLMDTAGQLQRKLALLFSVSQIEGYIGKLANVRGEFELQQRSLQAILQNKSQADQIFNKTVQLAVKSPYKIKELVSFTKQLAAYRIESSKLYDTTKRLADVSAGLGVDMGRLILAYGQVKAAAYLRGSEVRQFTEAGINMYGELQRYFQEIKGEAYTTAQIVDMISKRKVTFEDVENIFKRLTDSGGLFYNMQEIQAETLQGKISNLQDSIDVMLNSIGKANEGVLKGSIDGARALVENWEKVAAVLQIAVGAFLHIKTTSMIANTSLFKTMSLTFAYQRSLNATKMQAFFTSLQAGWKETARTLASSVGAISKVLSGAAIFVALNSLMTYFQNSSTHAKRIREITDEQEKENALVSKLVNSYNKLKDAESSEKTGSSNGENFEEKKKKLEELYRIFDKRTIKIPVELEKVTPENIDAVFNDAEKKLKGINNIISNALKYIEKDKANIEILGFTPFSESIIENTEEYADAVLELLSYKSDVEKAFDVATNNYQKLNKEAKKYYEDAKSLSDKYTKGEITNVEYIKGVYEALEVMRVAQQHKEIVPPMWLAKIGNHLNQLNYEMKTYEGELASAKRSWKELLNYMNNADGIISKINKGELSPKDFELTLDRIATDNNFSEGALEAFKSFAIEWANQMGANGLSFNIEKEDVKQELDDIDVIFKKWFSTHSYTLGIEYGDIGDKNIGKGIIKEGDNMAAAYKNAALVVERLKKSLDATFNQKQSGLSADLWSKYFGVSTEISKEQLIKAYEDIAKINKQAAIDAGWTEKSRAERDIWSERISVLKEMQSRYEKLNQLMGENAAIEQTLSAFKPALKFTGMDEMNILPTKEGMIKAYEELLKDVTDSKKITELKKIIAELKIEIQEEDLKNQLEKTKKNIEDMFNGLDLHQKLKDAGLSESEVQQLFPGLAKTLDDVQKGIEIEFQTKYADTYKDPNTQQYKEYQDAIKKLEQQRMKESQDLVVELTKSYKTQLSDQMQLDTWYIKERSKIYSKAYDEQTNTFKDVLTPEMQKQYEANLNKEYQKRSSENTWKNFQATDSYISMFENMDKMSGESIQRMLEKLESLRSSLKGLPADQVRAIINQMEKLREVQVERNPFKAAIDGIKELKEAREGLVKLDEKGESTGVVISEEEVRRLQLAADEEKVLAETEAQNRNLKLQDLELQREELVKYSTQQYKETDEYKNQLSDLNKKVADQRKLVNLAIIEAELQSKISHEYAEQLRNYTNAQDKIQKGAAKSLNMIATISGEASSAITDIAGNLENVFGTMSAGTKDTIDSISEILGGVGDMAGGVARVVANPADIGGYFQAIGGLAKTIGAVFAIGDKKKEREIQRQIKNIEELGKKYDELKEKMEAAWSADDLRTQTKDTIAKLDQQIASYQAMIRAEQGKKDIDQTRINEWNDTIKELEKTKKEILEEERKYMGGIGGEEEYRSAAESFVQAWMDAFNETGDGLKGLEENFDDMINNLFLKQASMRAVNKMLAPIFDIVDASVSEIQEAIDRGSDFEDILKEKIAAITDKADNILPVVNEFLGGLYGSLGLGNNKKAELSALQQGIQAMSEETAGELQALLNSIRFFVSQQTTDISAIRALLDARYSLESEYSDSNPMLVELRAQTGYLEILSDRIDRVFAPSANSKGAGLRVFMQ